MRLPDRPARPGSWLGALCGLVAAAVALGVAELSAALTRPQAAPVVAVGGSIIDAAPTSLKDFAIEAFGSNDKPVLTASILVVLGLLALGTGALAARRPAIGLLGVAALASVAAAAALGRPDAQVVDTLPSLTGGAVGGAVLVLLLRRLRALDDAAHGATADPQRRLVVTGLVAAAAGAVAGAAGRLVGGRRGEVAADRAAVRLPRPASPAGPVPRGADLKIPGVTPFRTPNQDFYRVDTALLVPQVPTGGWTLRVRGMVRREIQLDFAQLLARPMIERDITLACVSNEVGGRYVGNARWLGPPLADLLREAGVDQGADMLLSRSVDGFTIGTPTAVVLDGRDAMLAVGMHGQPLPVEHGFPVRMVVPGLYGYVSATKWLTELELTRFDRVQAYWTARGWAARGPVRTMSRIDTPRSFTRLAPGRVAVAGVAWAQHRGIARVEVRVDEGPWQEAELAPVPSIDTWRQWVWRWEATPGEHTLEVRATDGRGDTQTGRPNDPFPSGATGWHSAVVTVA